MGFNEWMVLGCEETSTETVISVLKLLKVMLRDFVPVESNKLKIAFSV